MGSRDAPRLSYWAQQEIDVNGEDVKDLALTLMEGMTISGRVVFEAKTEKVPSDPAQVRVTLEPLSVGRVGFSARPATIDREGNFTITGVTPGRYRLNANVSSAAGPPETTAFTSGSATSPGPRWMVKSSIVNGRDTIDVPVEIGAGEHVGGAVVTLTDQVTELSGSILDAAGKPVPDLMVVLFPTDRKFWTSSSRRLRAPYRSPAGTFRFSAIPAGEYHLAVLTEMDPTEWGDPAYLERLAGASITIAIGEGEKKVQDVRIGG
jgi:hypothetical protein